MAVNPNSSFGEIWGFWHSENMIFEEQPEFSEDEGEEESIVLIIEPETIEDWNWKDLIVFESCNQET